ncbi:MAG: hypothetical protein ACOZNI_35025 [Myxococcota bacterium]
MRLSLVVIPLFVACRPDAVPTGGAAKGAHDGSSSSADHHDTGGTAAHGSDMADGMHDTGMAGMHDTGMAGMHDEGMHDEGMHDTGMGGSMHDMGMDCVHDTGSGDTGTDPEGGEDGGHAGHH